MDDFLIGPQIDEVLPPWELQDKNKEEINSIWQDFLEMMTYAND